MDKLINILKQKKLIILIAAIAFSCGTTIYAQAGNVGSGENIEETQQETSTIADETMESDTQEESSLSEAESGPEANSAPIAPYVSFDDVIPYMQYLSYTYVRNNNAYDIIMEFYPDASGMFQVAVLTKDDTKAYVYQIRSSGLYELAEIDHYDTVEDLRQSADARDQEESLVIPRNLMVGTQFMSGYHNEKTCEVEAILPSYLVDDIEYEDVVKIKAEGPDGTSYQYYAPSYGLIKSEESDGSVVKLVRVDTHINQ